jgi:transposase
VPELCAATCAAGCVGIPRGVEVFTRGERCDMRRSFNTLSTVVQNDMKRDLMDGDLFLFVGKDRRRAKVLYFGGTGFCLFAKRMGSGHFPAPWKMTEAAVVALFIEGAAAVRQKLSPPIMRKVDLKSGS